MRNPSHPRPRSISGLAIAALVLALAACSPGFSDEPIPPLIGGTGLPDECAEAFPNASEAPDPDSAATVPVDWPDAPAGSTLCVVMQTSDTNAVLQYVTTATPDEVLDAWEPLLTQYDLVRGDGIGGNPILNATSADLEFAIQTDAGTGTYIVGFGTL